jgi:Cu/Ag efflux pump CusA
MWAFPCTYYLWVLSKFDLLVLADLLPLLPFALQASLEEGNGYVNRMRVVIASFPEVENVVSQHGRPDDGTDATGFLNAEFFAPLKPALQWPVGMDKERLTSEILEKLQAEFIGVEFNFSQYLQDNVSEAMSGVKGENSIKLFGNDLQALTKTANQIKEVLSKVHGITDLAVFTSLGQPTVQIDVDRAPAGRYGLTPGDINSTVRAAIGGESAGELYVPNSDQHFPIVVRLAPRYRESPEAIRDIFVGIQGDKGPTQIPLSEVADVDLVSGGCLHLSRTTAAVSSNQIQCARSRPRKRNCGSAAKDCSEGSAAGRFAFGVGRRIWQSSGRHWQAQNCRSDHSGPHCLAIVDQLRFID